VDKNVNLDSMLDDALAPAPAQRRAEVEFEGCVIKAASTSELVAPVNLLGEDEPDFLAELSASAELSIYDDNFQPWVEDGVTFPREASERIRAMSPSDLAAWRKMRYRMRTEPIFLANTLLGLSLQENPHAAFFLRLPKMVPGTPFSALAEAGRKFMLLWSRSLGKTSCMRTFIVMCFLNYPNLRVGWLAGSKDLGKEQLKPIKEIFESPSPRLKMLFPEYCLKTVRVKKSGGVIEYEDRIQELGTTTAFSLPCRTTRESSGSSFVVLSSDMRFSGIHIDALVIDDSVNNENSGPKASAAQMASVFQSYLQVLPLLSASRGVLVMTGTRYHQDDAYSEIMDRYVALEHGNTQTWTFDIQGCYSQGPCVTCGHYEIFHDRHVNVTEPPCLHANCECKGFIADGGKYLLFPEVILPSGDHFGYTFEGLEAMRQEDEKFFNLQMLNAPLAASHNIFTQSLINASTIHKMEDLPGYPAAPNAGEVFICGDLAFGGSDGNPNVVGDLKDRDENVIYVFRVCAGCIWVYHCVHGKWTENQKIEIILSLLDKVRPAQAFFEQAPGWMTLKERLRDYAHKYRLNPDALHITWTEVSNVRNAKALRTEQIEVAMQRDKVRILASIDGYDILVRQLLAYPKAKSGHDDFRDALAQCIAAPTEFWAQAKPEPMTPARRIHDHVFGNPNTFEEPDTRPSGSYDPDDPNDNWKKG
jgi:hypothetical protein